MARRYPGNGRDLRYLTLTAGNAFIIETEATADRETPLSLANHSYFNLAGEDRAAFPAMSSDSCRRITFPRDGRHDPLRSPRAGRGSQRRLQALARPRRGRAESSSRPTAMSISSAPPTQRRPGSSARGPSRGGALRPRARGLTDSPACSSIPGPRSTARWSESRVPATARTRASAWSATGIQRIARGAFGDILVRPAGPQKPRRVYAFSTC